MSGFLGGFLYGYHRANAGNTSGADARKAFTRSEAAEREVRSMDDRLERLTLVCMAMWSLLREYTDLKEEDLINRVQELDLLDGVDDDKLNRQVQRCPKCSRVMSPKHQKCLYCGYEKLEKTAFDKL